jgi:NAD(P)-dependent dehydrogenase (short-subunit alcohol dehydrogenase family)
MELGLSNRRALVSGSTAGIGLSIAHELAREGAEVIINGRTQRRVDQALKMIQQDVREAKLYGFAADLGTAQGVEELTSRFRDVDVLINNLGIFEPRSFADIRDEEWLRMFEVNVLSGIRLSRAYVPAMKTRGFGRVIFISSESAVQVPVEMIHYGMTKTAQVAVASGLAKDCVGTGVTVNSILVGPTASEGVAAFVRQLAEKNAMSEEQMEQEFFKTARPTSLLKRFIKPLEVASLVAYVASDRASATTGAALRVDGGLLSGIV